MNRITLLFTLGLLFILFIQKENAQTTRTFGSGANPSNPRSATSMPIDLDSLIWNGSQSTNWIDPLNWTPAGVPDEFKILFIPDATTTTYNPILPSLANASGLTLKSGAVLNAIPGSQLNIYNHQGNEGWNNLGGTFNPSTSTVVFINPGSIISGKTDFNNVTLFSNSGAIIQEGSVVRIAGVLSNSGILDATQFNNTIEYNGTSAQTIGDSSATTFYDLTINNASGVTVTSTFLTSVSNLLTINSGKKFIVAAGKQLTVMGTIDNYANPDGFVLQSNETGTASLIHNSNSIPATVQRYISGNSEDWHFLSSPGSNDSISGSWLPSGTYGNHTGYDLYVWNEPTSCWIFKNDSTSPIDWNTVHPGSYFIPGRGYLYSLQAANPTKAFSGNLNNGSISYRLTASGAIDSLKGFNLVGNPYPSSIDWQAASGWTRSNLTTTAGGYDMWIWNPTANNYGVFNSSTGIGTNSVTRYIPPMQGYFVQATANGYLSTDNNVRVHLGAGNWFKSTVDTSEMIRMVVQSESTNNSDEINLVFGFPDNQTGTTKLFSRAIIAPGLFLPMGTQDCSVRYLTRPDDNPMVPVRFKPGRNGNYTIHCEFDLGKFKIVMLEDCAKHYIQDMKVLNTYNFQSSTSDDVSRFILHFGADNNTSYTELPARIYYDGHQLVIDLTLVGTETETFVYDLLGRLLYHNTLQGLFQHKFSLNSTSQIVVVYLKNQQGKVCRKIVYN
jgi:hypothetical protein